MDDKVTRPDTAPAEPLAGEDKAPAPVKPGDARRSPAAIVLVALIVALLGYATYFALSPKQEAPRRGGRAGFGGAQPVGLSTVTRGDIKVELRGLLGAVTPIANVTVKTQLNGYLTEVAFKEGQLVKKGDFLAQVDPRPYEVLKAQYEGQLLHDQGLLDQARDDLKRYQSLKKLDSIARQQAENQVWVVKQYEGSVKADQALVDNQKLNMTYAHIVSPVNGRVGLRKVDAGSYVTTQDANGIVLVTQIDPISVIFSVPEDFIPVVATAQKKSGALEVAAFTRDDARQLAVGHLQSLDNTIDTTTGMVQARAEFENKSDQLYPNQFVNIHLLVDIHKGVLIMPTAAIRKGASGFFVYLVKGENRVATQTITPAGGENYESATENGMVEVLQGLSEGDRVVIDGADRLRDGAEIRIAEANEADRGAKPTNPDEPQPETQPRERRQWDPEKRREWRQKHQTE